MLTEVQVISNVITALTLTYSRIEKRVTPCKRTTESRGLFLKLNFGVDLAYYTPYCISFGMLDNSVCYYHFCTEYSDSLTHHLVPATAWIISCLEYNQRKLSSSLSWSLFLSWLHGFSGCLQSMLHTVVHMEWPLARERFPVPVTGHCLPAPCLLLLSSLLCGDLTCTRSKLETLTIVVRVWWKKQKYVKNNNTNIGCTDCVFLYGQLLFLYRSLAHEDEGAWWE